MRNIVLAASYSRLIELKRIGPFLRICDDSSIIDFDVRNIPNSLYVFLRIYRRLKAILKTSIAENARISTQLSIYKSSFFSKLSCNNTNTSYIIDDLLNENTHK